MSINALRDFHGLHDFHVRDVCRYLQDCDVKALGAASKELQPIAAAELDSRDEELERLLAPYTPTHKFNIQQLREADLLGVGNVHGNEECKANESALINHLTWRGPVILAFEHNASGSTIEASQSLRKNYPIRNHNLFFDENKSWLIERYNLSFEENIHLTGWDNRHRTDNQHRARMRQKDRLLREHVSRANEIWKQMEQMKALIVGHVASWKKNCTAEEEMQIGHLIDQENVLEKSEFELLLGAAPLQVADIFSKLMNMREEFTKLEKEMIEADFSVKRTAIHLDSLQSMQWVLDSFLSKKELKILFNYDKEEIREFRDKYSLYQDFWSQDQEFPIRTLSLVNTLTNVKNFIAQFPLGQRPRILVKAGCYHLETFKQHKGDDRWNLDRLYQELNNHKAVILIPTAPEAAFLKGLKELTATYIPFQADARRASPEALSSEE